MNTMDFVKSRFCPSPTGLMHLGNLRTGLFNVLLAKSYVVKNQSATFLLRIEDTDMVRSEEAFSQKIMEDLLWLGLDWQEGPQRGGAFGPYYQAQRAQLYQKYYQQLIQNQRAYWCFCTEMELSITRKTQLQSGIPPRYPGTCRHLSHEQIAHKRAKGIKPALRFRIPDHEAIHFEDFIQGPKSFVANDIGDFIIEKADGTASFMFCNALDDALMQVTHVMRGEDHLTNTPRQLLVLKALGLREPLYGHMPLILGYDGKPLSKRNGSQSIEALREQGYFPLAINNYLARLGHHIESDKLLSLESLGEHFAISHIGRSPARFDLAQLKHWQKECVLAKTDEEIWAWIKPYTSHVEDRKAKAFTQTIKQNIVLPSDALDWERQLITQECVWEEDALTALNTSSGQSILAHLEEAIQAEGEDYSQVINKLSNLTHQKGKALFLPLRCAITGRSYGPELAKIFSFMGKAGLLERVRLVKSTLKA